MPDRTPFAGFDRPRDNFYRLPNEWFDLFAAIRRGDIRPPDAGDDWRVPRIIAPLKVTEYVIKHTWGWSNREAPIRLSRSEIQHGRKTGRGARLDAGAGLGNSTLSRGIDLAQSLGLLTVEEDNTDPGRQQRHFLPRLHDEADRDDEAQRPGAAGLLPDVAANYFMVPKVWTDLCADLQSEIVILAVEYFFRHTWGWQSNDPTRPYWMDADDVASGRRHRSERRAERYDAGTGYSVRRMRDALEEAVRRGLLVWRYVEEANVYRYDADGQGLRPREYALRRPFMDGCVDSHGQYLPPALDEAGQPWDDPGGSRDRSGRGRDDSGRVRDHSGQGSDDLGRVWDAAGRSPDRSGQGRDESGWASDQSGEGLDDAGQARDGSGQRTWEDTPDKTPTPDMRAQTPSATHAAGAVHTVAAPVRLADDAGDDVDVADQSTLWVYFRPHSDADTDEPARRLTLDQAADLIVSTPGDWYWSDDDLDQPQRAEREGFTSVEEAVQEALDRRLLGGERAIVVEGIAARTLSLVDAARRAAASAGDMFAPVVHCDLWGYLRLDVPDRRRAEVEARGQYFARLAAQAAAWGDPDLVGALVRINISPDDARQLIARHGAGLVGGWLKALHHGSSTLRNPAGVLISKLRAGQLPPGAESMAPVTPVGEVMAAATGPAVMVRERTGLATTSGHGVGATVGAVPEPVDAILARIGTLLAALTAELQALAVARPDPRLTHLQQVLQQAQGLAV